MRVRIHRCAHEIGGNCIEVESCGQRIVLDVGAPLNVPTGEVGLYSIKGFADTDPSLLGVVISHPHQDHYGLAYLLPAETRFFVGRAAARILAATEVFSPAGITLPNITYLEDRIPIQRGPFEITPYLVDHSAFDAYAVLVEADGKRLFYSGDLRAHGRKAALFEQLVRDPPRDVDVLLMEGTTLGRPGRDAGFPAEADLEPRFVQIFRQTEGTALVWCSGQNIDRLVTVFRACKKAGRQLILDMYTAHVLRATGNPNIPQAHWDGVRVFLPYFQKRRVVRREAFEVSELYRGARIYPEEVAAAAPRSVMLFRPSMIEDLERGACLDGARVVYSMWDGYLEREEQQPFLRWLEHRGIPMDRVHTSGHAGAADLRRFAAAIDASRLVPIHTERRDLYSELFNSVSVEEDGKWWRI